jgi:hypothetical protein
MNSVSRAHDTGPAKMEMPRLSKKLLPGEAYEWTSNKLTRSERGNQMVLNLSARLFKISLASYFPGALLGGAGVTSTFRNRRACSPTC